jgi:hypothetical protein
MKHRNLSSNRRPSQAWVLPEDFDITAKLTVPDSRGVQFLAVSGDFPGGQMTLSLPDWHRLTYALMQVLNSVEEHIGGTPEGSEARPQGVPAARHD